LYRIINKATTDLIISQLIINTLYQIQNTNKCINKYKLRITNNINNQSIFKGN